MKIVNFIKDFRDSKNKFYFIVENIKVFIVLFVAIGGVLGVIGLALANKGFDLSVINNTIALFLVEWNDSENIFIEIAKSFALVSLFLGGVAFYAYRFNNSLLVKKVQKKPYSLIVGLGEQNSNFLKNLKDKRDVLVIEIDKNNKYIEYFRKLGFAILVGDAKEEIKNLDITNLQNVLISTANDRVSLAIALELSNKMKKESKIYINIENLSLSSLFKQNVLSSKNGADIIIYSLQDILVKELFAKHNILGNFSDIINSNKEYNIAIVGDSLLSFRLIYNIAIVSNLPKENRLNLYLVNKDAKEFLKRVKKQFSSIDEIEHLNLIAYELDSSSLDFYTNNLWHIDNLTNIYITYEDENKNLDIAVNMQDITFVQECANGSLKTKVFFAMYNDFGVSKKILEDKELFNNFYSFANFKEAITWDNIIDERFDTIAKLIHFAYLGEQKISKEELNSKWIELNLFKRDSNRAQAMHIDIKLLALGLKRIKSNKSLQELLEVNREIFNKVLAKDLHTNLEEFPNSFDNIISQLARAEHNRWNSFHFLNGWKYDKQRDDSAKCHNCLIPFNKFSDKEKDTYKWDVQSVMNIPLYLAHGGYEIVEIKNKNDMIVKKV